MEEPTTEQPIEQTPMEEFLTTEDVVRILKTSLTSIYALIDSGKLKGINIGRGKIRNNWRIRKSDLEAFLSGGQTNG